MKFNITREEVNSRIEPGTYPARVHSIKTRKSQNNNDMIILVWKIEGDTPPAGQTVPEMITLSPESYFRLDDVIQACGLQNIFDDSGFDTKDFQGAQCRIKVGYRTYEGKERTNVEGHLPL